MFTCIPTKIRMSKDVRHQKCLDLSVKKTCNIVRLLPITKNGFKEKKTIKCKPYHHPR